MAINDAHVSTIIDYIGNENKSNWYVGIATHPQERLFVDHNVNKAGRWIFNRYPMSEVDARDTEAYLLKIYPFRGDVGGGDHPQYVYAYKTTPWTKQ